MLATTPTMSSSSNAGPIPHSEVAKHNKEGDCWLVVNGTVYDFTKFLDAHPGGKSILMKYGGKDASKAFSAVHNTDMLGPGLPPEVVVKGICAADTGKTGTGEADKSALLVKKVPYKGRPPVEQAFNIYDLESVARNNCSKEAWGYLMSAGDDEVSLRENTKAFHRVFMRPRVLRNVSKIDMTVKNVFGVDIKYPFYISATALGKLYDPEGEVALTKAAGKFGIAQMAPTLASSSMEEMANARVKGQVQWYQLYVNPNRDITKRVIQTCEKLGYTALFVTVDAPQLGRRERDMRNKAPMLSSVQSDEPTTRGNHSQGTGKALSAFIDPSLNWDDIPWMMSVTKLPIMLKGIQTAEDALLAVKSGVAGIVISNHGGRQLDYCRSGLECLAEVMEALKKEKVDLEKFTVFVDGGIRRGGDVFKALAMGAKMVGCGRPFQFGLAAYGEAGVTRCCEILEEELGTVMKLAGAPTMDDITEDMVMTKNLTLHTTTGLDGFIDYNYQRMITVNEMYNGVVSKL